MDQRMDLLVTKTNVELAALCRGNGMTVSGSKRALLGRLSAWFCAHPNENLAPAQASQPRPRGAAVTVTMT